MRFGDAERESFGLASKFNRNGIAVRNPKGVVAQSPRLLYSATLGQVSRSIQPQRGCGSGEAKNEKLGAFLWPPIPTQPFQGWATNLLCVGAAHFPRVAKYGNPGLRGATPLGLPNRGLSVPLCLTRLFLIMRCHAGTD